MNFIIVLTMLLGTLAVAAYAIPLHFYARYIAKNHPNLWKQLGSPNLTTAQGSRHDPLAQWISRERYLRMSDPNLARWGRTLRKLQSVAWFSFLGIFVVTGLCLAAQYLLEY